MKKVLNLLTAVYMMGSFLMPATAMATTYTLDQSATNTNPIFYENIAASPPHEQGFRPTQNRIKKVFLKIGGVNMSGGTPIKLSLLAFGSPTVLAEKITMPTVSGPETRVWEFDSEVTITPEARYTIKLEKTGGPGTPYWYTAGDTYARGTASKGGVVMGYDYDFQTYGYTYTAPTPPPADNPAPSGNTQTTDSASLSSAAKYANVVVDASIKTPVLTSIEVDKKKTNAPITKEVILGTTDKLKMNGTSFKGAKVAIFIGEKATEATVDAEGNWTAEVTAKNFKDGQYTILGQARTSDTKGSEKAELLKIKILAVKTGTQAKDNSWFAGWNIFYVLIPVGILLLLLLLLALIARRHHQEKISGKGKPKKEEKNEEKK